MAEKPVKLKLQRNGQTTKKLIIKPATFAALLELCTKKLAAEGDGFQARRLFTNEGFEIEEDAYDVVSDGDAIVASAGEEYIDPADVPKVTSLELLTALDASRQPSTSSSASGVRPLTSSSVGSFAVTPKPPALHINTSYNTSASSLRVPEEATPARLYTHLTVLQAAPLIARDPRDPNRVKPLPLLDLQKEREELCSFLRDSRTDIAISFEPATTDALRRVATMGATALHYSGHGEESYLAFEDGFGGTHSLTPQLLASTCTAGSADTPTGLQLVFVCACHSQPAAAAFERAGVPHVVAVRSHTRDAPLPCACLPHVPVQWLLKLPLHSHER